MSHRGYGDPPYPPDHPGNRGRPASDRGQERRGNAGTNVEGGPPRIWEDDPRRVISTPTEQGRNGGARWNEGADERLDPAPVRQGRSRWSNPPPRRRRGAAGSRAPLETGPIVDRRSPDFGVAPTFHEPYRDPFVDPDVPHDWDDRAGAGTGSDPWANRADAPRPSRRPSGLADRIRGGRTRAANPAQGATETVRRTPRRRSSRTFLSTVRLPGSLTRAELPHDQIAVLLLGLGTLSVVVMAGVLVGRLGNLDDVIVLRDDATGAPTRWGTPESLWELPLLAGMITLANLILAWWISSYDRFASRLLLAAALVVGLLTWIPLVRYLW